MKCNFEIEILTHTMTHGLQNIVYFFKIFFSTVVNFLIQSATQAVKQSRKN